MSKTSRENALGLRLYLVPPEANSKRVSRFLAQSGLVETGDILLSFRQGTVGTGEYQHIQLGLTHTGMALVREGELFNLDSPISYSGQLDHDHYTEDQLMLHVLRPNFKPGERENIQRWVEMAFDSRNQLASKVSFNSDYGAPKSAKNAQREVFNLGSIIASGGSSGHETSMYCSEFAWHLLALRACNVGDSLIRKQFISGNIDAFTGDIQPLFSAMPVLGAILLDPNNGDPGLSDGIGLVLESLEIDNAQFDALLERAFSEWDPYFSGGRPPYSISSGHREQARKFAPLYDPLKAFFRACKTNPDTARKIKAGLDLQLKGQENYSPTAYLVQALVPEISRRVISYVGTLSFPTTYQYSVIENKFPQQYNRMMSMRPEAFKAVSEPVVLAYKDGYRGARFFKRQQVKKLQCMLLHLGFDVGEIDGLYGNRTVKAVRQLLKTGGSSGDGHSISFDQWQALENQAGDACSEFGS